METASSTPLNIVNSLNRYQLAVHNSTAPLDVESFVANEHLSRAYRYVVEVTSEVQDIDPQTILMQDASFIMQSLPATAFNIFTPPQVQRTVHGVITQFARLSESRDEAHYRLTLEPHVVLLDHTRRCAIYQNMSVPEIVEKILRDNHRYQGWQFEFRLNQSYPRRELVTQWQLSDFDFIRRLLSEVGIWFTFEMDNRLKEEVVIFGDAQQYYQFDVKLPVKDVSGMNDNAAESVWSLSALHQIVESAVKVKDYNYRDAANTLAVENRVVSEDKTTTGTIYHYAEGFLKTGGSQKPEPDSAGFYAFLRHERDLNDQHQLWGKTNAIRLAPGQMLEIDGIIPKAYGKGILITGTVARASRSTAYQVTFTGIPYSETVGFRPALRARPKIIGTVPARITSISPNDIYSHIDKDGRYRLNFNFDLDTWKDGYESPWLRLARAYAGDTYGLHLVLLAGTEVAVAFDGGHPDKPYIAHALHDSRHPDHVTIENYKRNVLRTPANNKLRLDDERGKEHVKVATEYGKSQVSIGHLVDNKKEQRGEGFELRTDHWGAIRAAKGIFISADGQLQAQGKVLDMHEALDELQAAHREAISLHTAAEQAKAELADIEKQASLMNDTLKQLQQRALLLSAPAGIAHVTPASLQLSAGENLIVTTGQNADISIAQKLRIASGEILSLFAKAMGIKMFAAAGRIQIQAQSDALDLFSKKDMTIASSDSKVTVSAKTELLLECGGGFIRIKGGNVEIGGPGSVSVKSATLQKVGPDSQNASLKLPEHCASMIDEAAAGQGPTVSLS